MSDTRLEASNIDPTLPASADPLADVLQMLQLSVALLCDARLSAPWGIEIPALPGVMNVNVVTSGHCWVELDGQPPLFVPEGNLILIPLGNRHVLRGSPNDSVTKLQEISVEKVGNASKPCDSAAATTATSQSKTLSLIDCL